MGYSLVFGGVNGVLWNEKKGDFPFSRGFLPVVLSWFVSPLIGGILSSIIFILNRWCILRRSNSTIKAIWSLPILLFFTLFINIMFVLAKVRLLAGFRAAAITKSWMPGCPFVIYPSCCHPCHMDTPQKSLNIVVIPTCYHSSLLPTHAGC
jgi:phosphate/sulfate permease